MVSASSNNNPILNLKIELFSIIYLLVAPIGYEHITPAQYKAMQGKLTNKSNPIHIPQPQLSASSATPVVGSNVVMQSRRLYVGNIPFGVSEVNNHSNPKLIHYEIELNIF